MSDESEYDCGEDVLEEEDLCDYNGDPCIGDKMFCEVCPVLTGDWEPEKTLSDAKRRGKAKC
jgi:hypothetical protein